MFGPNQQYGPFAPSGTPVVMQPQPRPPKKTRQQKALELETRQLTDASAALARKLRGDLMLTVLQPMLRGQPPRDIASRLLTALDHLNMTTGDGKGDPAHEPMWQPNQPWSPNLDPDERGIPLWERLRRLGRHKQDPVYEWEICYALYNWVNQIPGNTIAQKKQSLKDHNVAANLSFDFTRDLEQAIQVGPDFRPEWSVQRWWKEQSERRGHRSAAEAAAHEWDHPGLTASRIVRTDFARQVLQPGGIELGITGGSELFGVRPPSHEQMERIFAAASPATTALLTKLKLDWAAYAINWGIGPTPEGANQPLEVDKRGEARLARRVGNARERIKRLVDGIARSQNQPNLTNPTTQNLRTDRVGELLQAIGTASAPLWYIGTVTNRAELLAAAIAGGASLVAGIGLKYGLRGYRGLREKGMPVALANISLNRARKAHETALNRFLKETPTEKSRGFFRRK